MGGKLQQLTSGRVATLQVQSDLLEAQKRGETAMQTLIPDHTENHQTNIFVPIKALKLRTFSDQHRRKAEKQAQRARSVKDDRSLFAKMVIMAQARSFKMCLLSHSLTHVSWPLTNANSRVAHKDSKVGITTCHRDSNSGSIGRLWQSTDVCCSYGQCHGVNSEYEHCS